MEPQPDKEMAALYARFVAALERSDDLSDFSEDDLLDIYDFSRSVPDDYVALEVLATCARYYPGSVDMAKRKVLFFHDFEQDSAVLSASRALSPDSLVRQIAALKAHTPKSVAEASRRLNNILANIQPRSIEDGDLYFLIETYNDLGFLDAIADAHETIAGCCAFPSTLYHELAKIYSEQENVDKAIPFYQALTVNEPFVAQWWEELAGAYFNLADDKEAALEAIDYALALSPESIDGRLMKATMLSHDDGDASEAIVKEVLADMPDYRPALFLQACLFFKDYMREDAFDSLIAYVKSAMKSDEVPDRAFFKLLVERYGDDTPQALREVLFTYIATLDSSDVYQWALSTPICFERIVILEMAKESRDLADFSALHLRMLAEAYYITGQCEKVQQLLESLPECDSRNDLGLTLIYCLSRYRLGLTQGLEQYIAEKLKENTLVVMDGLTDTENSLMLRGARHYLTVLADCLKHPYNHAPEEYDPYIV